VVFGGLDAVRARFMIFGAIEYNKQNGNTASRYVLRALFQG